jgi:hypothetical protein
MKLKRPENKAGHPTQLKFKISAAIIHPSTRIIRRCLMKNNDRFTKLFPHYETSLKFMLSFKTKTAPERKNI